MPGWAATQPTQPQAASKPAPPANKGGMERFIGADLLPKIGISFVVIGICAFIVYALEQDLLGTVGQIILGMISGLGLIGIGLGMRSKNTAFSTLFIGGGLALLYFTVYIAFSSNTMSSQLLAFLTLIIVTALSVLLSLKYNRVELAILAVAGAYITPIVLRSGLDGNFIALFFYLLVLNTGMLALGIYKEWIALPTIALGFTALVFLIWMRLTTVELPNAAYGSAYGFLFFFTIQFFLGSLVYTLRYGELHKGMNISILIINAFFGVTEGAYLMLEWRGENDITFIHPLFLAVLYGAVAIYLVKDRNRDDDHGNALALVAGVLLVAAPLIATDLKLWLLWTSVGSFVLVALGRGLDVKGLVNAGQITVMISWFGVLIDLLFYYGGNDELYGFQQEEPRLFLNWVSIGALLTVLSGLGQLAVIHTALGTDTRWLTGPKTYGYLLVSSMVAIVYLTGMVEIVQFTDQESAPLWIRSGPVAGSLFSVLFFTLALVVLPVKRIGYLLEVLTSFGVLSVFVCAVVTVDRVNIIQENAFALPQFAGQGVPGAILTSASSVVFIIIAMWRMLLREGRKGAMFAVMQWAAVFTVLYYFSFLLRYLYVEARATSLEDMQMYVRQIHRTGYTILWGGTAFLLFLSGLLARLPHLRYAALSLLLMLSAKLLLIDLSESSTLAKIAAFIILGFLMLIISFTYQKMVRFFEDKDETPKP